MNSSIDLSVAQRYSFAAVVKIVGQQDAEDVLQEAAIRAFVNRQQFRKRSSYNTWFYRIAVNTALMWLRAHWRDKSDFSIDGPRRLDAGVGDNDPVFMKNALEFRGETPEEFAARSERERRLYDAISRLSTRKRKLAALRWLAGETARGAEKAARHKAKRQLREMLCAGA